MNIHWFFLLIATITYIQCSSIKKGSRKVADQGKKNKDVVRKAASVKRGYKVVANADSKKDSFVHGAADIWKINAENGVAEYLNEGDMILTNKQTYEEITGKNLQGDAVDVQYDATNAWPNREVPYVFDSTVTDGNKRDINRAIQTYNAATCIRFIPRTTQTYYVRFRSINRGCSSYVGMQRSFRNGQPITLQDPGCYSQGTIIHEMTHAVGYYHEQSRSDRDQFVNVNFNNIINGLEYNFEKRVSGNQLVDRELTPYDISSVMHYSGRAFSKNGGYTITVKKDSSKTSLLGQRNGFSLLDICGINKLYGCKLRDECQNVGVTGSGGTTTTTTTKPVTTSTTTANTVTTTTPTTSPIVTGSGCPSYVNNCFDTLGKSACRRLRILGMCAICLVQTEMCAETCTSLQGDDDKNSNCPFWARRRFCLNRFSAYMFINCKESCVEREQCRPNLGSRTISL